MSLYGDDYWNNRLKQELNNPKNKEFLENARKYTFIVEHRNSLESGVARPATYKPNDAYRMNPKPDEEDEEISINLQLFGKKTEEDEDIRIKPKQFTNESSDELRVRPLTKEEEAYFNDDDVRIGLNPSDQSKLDTISPRSELIKYLSQNNYGPEDYDTYSKEREYQRLLYNYKSSLNGYKDGYIDDANKLDNVLEKQPHGMKK